MAFSIVSYNVLANSYIRHDWYPHTSPEELAWSRRQPALVEAVAGMGSQVICLQEVERDLFRALEARLIGLGYAGRYLGKGQGKPDGCATFFQQDLFALEEEQALKYRAGGSGRDSGHVMLILHLWCDGGRLAVANTHLKWDPPGTSRDQQWGYRQVVEFLQRRQTLNADPDAWIVCGDFNVAAEGDAVQALVAAGFTDVYQEHPQAFTCNSNRRSKRIDYIFVGRRLTAVPSGLPIIDDDTPLPSITQPSDHLAIGTTCRWREETEEGLSGPYSGTEQATPGA